MVKKSISFLICLTILISSMSFYAFADDNLINGSCTITFTMDGNTFSGYRLVEGLAVPIFSNPSSVSYKDFVFNSITWNNSSNDVGSTFVSFKIGFVLAYGDTSSEHIFPSAPTWQSVSTTSGTLFPFSQWVSNVVYLQNFESPYTKFNWFEHQALIKAQFTSNRTLNYNSTFKFRTTVCPSTESNLLYVYFYDVNILPNLNWFIAQIIHYYDGFSTQLLSIAEHTASLLFRLTDNDIWRVSSDYYDDDGNFHSSRIVTSWYGAIFQLLSNIYAPIQRQAQQEQRAKDAGALDALDSAYDAASDKTSFWDMLDIINIGDIGDYDDDALDSAGSDSILSWFSHATDYDINGSKKYFSSDPNEQIVDFYSSNQEDILSYFGGDYK